MEQSLKAMTVALRVLTALGIEKRPPDPADVEELKRLAPLRSDAPLEELACDVIQQAVKRNEEIRKIRDERKFGGA